MIERTQAYRTEAGVFNTLEEAQNAELLRLFQSIAGVTASEGEHAVHLVRSNADAVLDILTTTATSRPKARKSNGGTKKRKSKEDKEAADLKTALQE